MENFFNIKITRQSFCSSKSVLLFCLHSAEQCYFLESTNDFKKSQTELFEYLYNFPLHEQVDFFFRNSWKLLQKWHNILASFKNIRTWMQLYCRLLRETAALELEVFSFYPASPAENWTLLCWEFKFVQVWKNAYSFLPHSS